MRQCNTLREAERLQRACRRQLREVRRVARGSIAEVFPLRHLCNHCGEPGPHFAPPSFGEPGFYICERRPTTT